MTTNNIMFIIFFSLMFVSFLCAQDSTTISRADSIKADSLKKASLDNTLFFKADSLSLQLPFSTDKNIPKNIITMPKPPTNPLEIDRRTSSYYTPRNVQDKMDQIMNRPRSDTFMPVMAMAFFAASIAAKQLEIDKLFELKAKDYFIQEDQFSILEKLWVEAPRRIDNLYLTTDLKDETTAKELQNHLTLLADNGLIKTRDAGENNILFYPAQKSEKVIELFKSAMNDSSNSVDIQIKLNDYLVRLQKISPASPE